MSIETLDKTTVNKTMTFVEFFDRADIENICTCLVNVPQRVIILGERLKLLKKHAINYQKILKNRGFEVEFICREINKNNLNSIVDILSNLVETYDDCFFDLTGGGELYLVAMGIIYERYKDKKIQMHRFNIQNNHIIDCDQDGITITQKQLPKLSVSENILIYGGDIVYDDIKKEGTYDWELNPEFQSDIDKMWDICKKDVRLWNAQMGILEVAEICKKNNSDPLIMQSRITSITNCLKQRGARFIFIKSIFNKLYQNGLITTYEYDEEHDRLSITYKNEQVKKCLIKAGQVLEMKVYKTLKEAKDVNGELLYNDVMNGVVIDWDGEIHTDENALDTENEIDVLAMKGGIPIFISCKNGIVSNEELYKLNAVAERFGGKYARKVLIATSLSATSRQANDFRQRAKDMNIRLVEGLPTMTDQEFMKTIKALWSI